ncbi:MAG: hypothetical protein ACI8WB_001389 [Phenylobacterium sp.]|jgi:hypothetical protein
MTDTQPASIDLASALDEHLNARPVTKKINSLLQGKRKTINYRPDYQRNYVWDEDKATFFIESILLGIEIPPLIMFISANDNKTYEVIDGRQRYETIVRFINKGFRLSKKGLRSLTGLKSLYFDELKPEIRQLFLDTTLRTIEFSTIGKHENQDKLEELIKKEIFWRYNSGITPLKSLEVQRARHLRDNFTELMDVEFADNPLWLTQFKRVFFAKTSAQPVTDAQCQAKIRELLVLEHFPINIYASASGRPDKVEWLYELYIEGAEDKEAILQTFITRIAWLDKLFEQLNQSQWIIYQGVYWALVIIEQDGIDYNTVFDHTTLSRLADAINTEIDMFIGDERGLFGVTNQRFAYIASFFEAELAMQDIITVDFKPFLKRPLQAKQNQQADKEIKDVISQLDSMRLNRPDAVTITIEDIVSDMSNNHFLIRPNYQRHEVINNKKASGIIESMLLGIPLPSIFIFRRKDGVCEVVDGQQRLLSILSFIGEQYIDEKGIKTKSKYPNYKLSKNIRVLTDFGGKPYHQLEEQWQDKIQDFELSVVYIDEKLNEHFDPIDLFIRLNNKPYPVKDHTFEMWNSYADRTFITSIKTIESQCRPWFYYRKDSTRMENEELLSVLAYLSYAQHQTDKDVFDLVDIYNWAPRPLTFRLPKMLLTEWLTTTNGQQNSQRNHEITTSLADVQLFVNKALLLTRSLQHPTVTEAESFNLLLGMKGTKRLQKPFYILWFLLSGLDMSLIEKQATNITPAIIEFITDKHALDKVEDDTAKAIFKRAVTAFWQKFTVH